MSQNSNPQENLSLFDSICIIVGVVVGVGIFRTPSIIAAVSESASMLLSFWIIGGLICLAGALCYAELASAYPSPGGDYLFLKKAFNRIPAFLFGWSRMTIIQSGSIAMVAFIIGDYAAEIFSFGNASNAIYAVVCIATLTFINILGIKQGKRTQNALVSLILLGILMVVCLSIFLSLPASDISFRPIIPQAKALGTAMIFVLLTYGGWNEAAFISAEINKKQKNIAKALIFSIGIITLLYLLINIALVRGLGLTAMAESKTVISDLLRNTIGNPGAKIITALILIAALSTLNATIITGARTNYALGNDYSFLRFLGRWKKEKNSPINALLVQCAISSSLVAFGARSRDGFVTMVEYTAPVFWFFFLLVGISIFILRNKYPETRRPFSVPFYPIIPFLFCLSCLYMLYASIAYTGFGSLAGMVVLLSGVPFLMLDKTNKVLYK